MGGKKKVRIKKNEFRDKTCRKKIYIQKSRKHQKRKLCYIFSEEKMKKLKQ